MFSLTLQQCSIFQGNGFSYVRFAKGSSLFSWNRRVNYLSSEQQRYATKSKKSFTYRTAREKSQLQVWRMTKRITRTNNIRLVDIRLTNQVMSQRLKTINYRLANRLSLVKISTGCRPEILVVNSSLLGIVSVTKAFKLYSLLLL